MSMSLLRPSFSNRATRLRAFALMACESSAVRGSTIVQWAPPSTKFICALPNSASYTIRLQRNSTGKPAKKLHFAAPAQHQHTRGGGKKKRAQKGGCNVI